MDQDFTVTSFQYNLVNIFRSEVTLSVAEANIKFELTK